MRYRYYPPTKPLATDKGLATKNLKGDNWWAKRWITTLEGFLDSRRLARGRTYARKGQVLELELHPLEAVASVQGSRRTPYTVRMEAKPLSEKQWQRVSELLSGRALYVAQLLAGEVPPEIEELFAEAGATLLPSSRRDLKITCSCPDWADVCKHAAAVAYLLGEMFDQDPFGLFLLRGRSREELLAALGSPGGEPEPEEVPAVPLPADLADFWSGGELPPVDPPATPAAQMQLLKRLGQLAGESVAKLLGQQYRQMSEEAVGLWAGEEGYDVVGDDG